MTRISRTLSALLLVAVLALAGCSSGGGNQAAETQEDFGVRMARMNLWREALFRFRRAVEIAPADAMAHNNLAVAYEANGDFDNALKSYREAIRLDKGNQYIQKNYSRFVEFTSRNRKREQRAATTPKPGPAETKPESEGTPVAAANAPTPDEPATPAEPGAKPENAPPGSVVSPAPAGTAPASIPSPTPPQPEPQKPPGDLS